MSTSPPIQTVHIVAFKTQEQPNIIDTRVTPEIVNLSGISEGVSIVFQVETRGYEFRRDIPGIQFTSEGWERSFTTVEYSSDYRSATVNNVNQSGLAYSYLVNVREIASGLTGSFDPVIQNENR